MSSARRARPARRGRRRSRPDRGSRPEGPQGDQGDPGAPSFIISDLLTRTAGDLATTAPTGLVPANFDGPGRPAAPYQMKPGEAWMHANPADNPALFGQAIVVRRTSHRSADSAWIAMSVTGPKGDQGDQPGRKDRRASRGAGQRGSRWFWSPISPPDPPSALARRPNPGACSADPEASATAMSHGPARWRPARPGNIRGPAGPTGGPKGDPGDVSWADLLPVVQRIDGLEARVDRLESFQLQTLANDRVLADSADVIIATVGLTEGDYLGSGHLTFELTNPAATGRLITAWVSSIGGAVITGPASASALAAPGVAVCLGRARPVPGAGVGRSG